jgi:retron-type reverse transcriptase
MIKKMDIFSTLLEKSGLPAYDLMRVIDTAPQRYKTFQIRKRNGGWRQIAQPARELKLLQRILLEDLLTLFPVHAAAMAYEPGRNIRQNAEAHIAAEAMIKMDFSQFFPSIMRGDWTKFARKAALISEQDILLTARLFFWGDGTTRPRCLSIGAPTSPRISNILLYNADCYLSDLAQQGALRYTRYADDITVSGPDIGSLIAFEKNARKFIQTMKSPKLTFNEEKRGIYQRGQKLMVTGLIITPDRKISLGRERKRLASTLIHRVQLNQASAEQIAEAKGLLAFAASAEPDFIGRMREKYGSDVVSGIMSFVIPPRNDR